MTIKQVEFCGKKGKAIREPAREEQENFGRPRSPSMLAPKSLGYQEKRVRQCQKLAWIATGTSTGAIQAIPAQQMIAKPVQQWAARSSQQSQQMASQATATQQVYNRYEA